MPEGFGQGAGYAALVFHSFGVPEVTYDAIDTLILRVEGIIAPFVPDDHEDGEAAGDAQGEAKDVYKRKNLVFGKIPEGDSQVVAEHDSRVNVSKKREMGFYLPEICQLHKNL